MATKRNQMNDVQRIALWEVLKKVCRKKGEHAIYKEGWSDQKVLDEINVLNTTNRPYTRANIVGLRHQMFGQLKDKPSRRNPAPAKLYDMIEELTKRVEVLERRAGSRPGRPQSSPPAE